MRIPSSQQWPCSRTRAAALADWPQSHSCCHGWLPTAPSWGCPSGAGMETPSSQRLQSRESPRVPQDAGGFGSDRCLEQNKWIHRFLSYIHFPAFHCMLSIVTFNTAQQPLWVPVQSPSCCYEIISPYKFAGVSPTFPTPCTWGTCCLLAALGRPASRYACILSVLKATSGFLSLRFI